jgi:phenylacetyl-CoA:acceptor oxidoreductase subunit 2
MIDPKTGSIPYGPDPWHQTSWDVRAAGNFVFGGVGSGLIVFTVASGASGAVQFALFLAGLAFVGLGLVCVALETGRPLRAMNVFVNPRTSWMSREAIAAVLLIAAGAAVLFSGAMFAWLAAALAIAFAWCQANILRAARGIPAWREPLVVPLVVMTALTEGAGAFFAASPVTGSGTLPLLVLFGLLVVIRLFVWLAYRKRIAGRVDARAEAALDRAGAWLQYAGTLAPLAIVALVAAGAGGRSSTFPLAAIAGALATLTGGYCKYTLITRAGFNQGFALVHMPVRGVRRS